MSFIKRYWLYLLIVVASLVMRFVNLDQVPSALYYDEIDLGYQMRSLVQTGKDYRGGVSPFYFRSFNTDKTPLPIILSIPFSLWFTSPEYQVRSGTAFAGVLVVVLAMFISDLLFKNKINNLVTGVVFAFSPWLVHFSRLAFEAQFALLFYFGFFALFLYWQKTKSIKYLYFSVITLAFSTYTYRTMSLLSPLVFLVTCCLYYKEILKTQRKHLFFCFSLYGLLVGSFLYATTIGSKDQTRISQISIFSDPKIAIEVQRNRELVSGNFQNPTPGQKANLQSKIFHNKAISYLDRFKSNVLNNFSPSFLFLQGDPNGRHSAKNTGELLFVDFAALLIGFYFLFKKDFGVKHKLLIAILVLGLVPADLTLDGANHASRLITFAGPLLIVVGYGYTQIIESLSKSVWQKPILVLSIVFWLFTLFQFINIYFYHFPVINSREFGYGYKQAIAAIEKNQSAFQKIYLTGVNDPPMLYYFYWANISPSLVQKYGTEFGDNITKNSSLDKVKPFYPTDLLCKEEQIKKLDPNNLYLVDYRSLPLDFRTRDKDKVPSGIKLIDIIKYPDNEIAYYLITRDTKNKVSVMPDKGQICK